MCKYVRNFPYAAAVVVSLALAPTPRANAATPPVPEFHQDDPARYGEELARYMDLRDQGWKDAFAKLNFTLIGTRGDKVQRTVQLLQKEGEEAGNKSLIRFVDPVDIRGVALLIHEHPESVDDSWLYLPATQKTQRISGANRTASFQGTEFTYEDLSSLEILRYKWRFLESGSTQGSKVYKLEAIPQYRESGYSRLVVHLNQEHWRVEQIDFYDKAGRRLKTLVQRKWTHHHAQFWRAQELAMTNQQTQKKTVIDVVSLFLDIARYPGADGQPRPSLGDEKFTKRALERM